MRLGVFQAYAATVLWQMLDNDVYHQGHGLLPEGAVIEHGVCRLRFALEGWYKKEAREHPDWPLYMLQDFGRHLLGSKDKGALGAKAAESGTLCFAADMADAHKATLLGGLALLRAGQALLQYMEITRRCSLTLPAAELQALVDCAVRYFIHREPAGTPFKPKMHLSYMWCMVQVVSGTPCIWAHGSTKG